MNPEPALPPIQPGGPPNSHRVPSRRSWMLHFVVGLLVFILIIVASVAITVWWIQRPIKPVVLSAAEKATVEQKLEHFDSSAKTTQPNKAELKPKPESDRPYVAGTKELQLTERELNGLLNLNTELGQTVRLELARDAINAYLAMPIPQDFPVAGGKMFRARGRFRISLDNKEAPYAILEDVTVFGLSLPKEWLGGLKGQNLITKAVGERNGSPRLHGVKSLRIVPGAIVLEVDD